MGVYLLHQQDLHCLCTISDVCLLITPTRPTSFMHYLWWVFCVLSVMCVYLLHQQDLHHLCTICDVCLLTTPARPFTLKWGEGGVGEAKLYKTSMHQVFWREEQTTQKFSIFAVAEKNTKQTKTQKKLSLHCKIPSFEWKHFDCKTESKHKG